MYRGFAVMFVSITLAATMLCAQIETPAPQSSPTTSEAKPPVPEEPATLSTKTAVDEDWTTIYLAKSRLPLGSTGGILLSKVELQGCTRELLRMQWRTNDPIDLYVIRPRGTEKMPVVLFLYNYTFDTNLFREDRWCDLAKQNGYAAAGFASALSWQRFHAPRPMKEWFVSELQEALAASTHDVQMILNYLETRGDLNMQHVGMFGQGSGGAIAILAAAADPRIGVLDLMDPWGDWPDWLQGSKQIPEEERAAYLQPDFLQRVSSLDPLIYLPQLKSRTLRIQQDLADPAIPAAARDKIAHAAPGADQVARYSDRTAEAKALGTNGIVGWLGEKLHTR